MIREIMSVAVVVSNGEKAVKWYTEKLGFKQLDNEEHWITVGPSGAKTVLHLCESKKLEPGNTGIALTVDDIDEAYKEMSKKGVVFTKTPRDEGWGKYAMFKDPDGNEFWLYPKWKEEPKKKASPTRELSNQPSQQTRNPRW